MDEEHIRYASIGLIGFGVGAVVVGLAQKRRLKAYENHTRLVEQLAHAAFDFIIQMDESSDIDPDVASDIFQTRLRFLEQVYKQ